MIRIFGAILRRLKPILYLFIVQLLWLFRKKNRSHNLDHRLVLSVTSFKPRFSTLNLTLKCALNQTVKPDVVVLWIAHEDAEFLPKKVTKLKKHGLEIKFTENIKSFKKIIPSIETYGTETSFITIDDDTYYPLNMVETLLNTAEKNKGHVIARKTHIVTLDDNNVPKPYIEWQRGQFNNSAPFQNYLIGVGGVFYPKGCFYKDILRKDLFLKLCPNADDVWLFWMIRLNNHGVINTDEGLGRDTIWPGSQKEALSHSNVFAHENDSQIANMVKHYGFPQIQKTRS